MLLPYIIIWTRSANELANDLPIKNPIIIQFVFENPSGYGRETVPPSSFDVVPFIAVNKCPAIGHTLSIAVFDVKESFTV